MSENRKRKNKRRFEADRLQQRYNAFMTGLALFVLTIAPLVFRMVRLEFVSPAITNTTTADTSVMNDVFTHYKMLMYYALSIALAIIFAARLLTTEDWGFRLTRYDAALAALCAFLLLSCLVSRYRVIALNGFIYMLDGTAGHICYCLLFFFGYHVFSRSAYKKWLYVPLYVCGLINALISLLNFSGYNMIDNAIIKTVLGVPANAVATNARAFTSTFGNANYLSGFGGVLFAVFFAKLMFSAPAFHFAAKTAGAAKTVDAASSPPRSVSKTAGASSSPPGSAGKPAGPGTTRRPAGKTTAAVSSPSRSAGKTAPRVNILDRADRSALLQNASSFLMIAASFSIVVTSLSSSGFLTFVVMVPVIVVFAALRGVTRRCVMLAAASLAVCALILTSLASINNTVYDETLGMFKMLAYGGASEDEPPVIAAGGRADARFDIDEGRAEAPSPPVLPLSAPLQPYGLLAEAPASAGQEPGAAYLTDFELPSYFPESSLSPGTGRLYIWKETLRLIAQKPVTGYGMDTLSYAFPQNHLDKVAGLGSYSIYVTKPHNAYIGYAYGAGIPALIAFLALNVFAAVAFLRWFFSRRAAGEAPDVMIMCAFLGWAAYLAQAFVNDDLISTAPLWWTLFGVGAGLIAVGGEEK